MDPWKSWAVVGVVGAGAAYYYSQSGKTKRGQDRTSSLQAEHTHRQSSNSRTDSKDARKKKGKGKTSDSSDRTAGDAAEVSSASTPQSSTNKTKKRRGDKQQPSRPAQNSAIDATNANHELAVELDDGEGVDEEMSSKEFATQMLEKKKGTSLRKPDTSEKEIKKPRKQGKSRDLLPSMENGNLLKPSGALDPQDMSTASSTTGADADDDLSLPVSPNLSTTQAITPSGGDISDMLETPAQGPSVLRLAPPKSTQPAKQLKPKKTNPEPETKKQRQNRQKNEENKSVREQAEKERRVLLEKQLRTAREAEGRPAKNGLSASKAPTTSVWKPSADSTADAATPVQPEVPKSDADSLLDTFEEEQSFLVQHAPQLNGGADRIGMKGDTIEHKDLPSEEEQLKLISEMENDNTWSTVTKGGKGKKKSSQLASTNGSNTAGGSNFDSRNDDSVSYNYTDKTVTKDHSLLVNGGASNSAHFSPVPDPEQTASQKIPTALPSHDLQNTVPVSKDGNQLHAVSKVVKEMDLEGQPSTTAGVTELGNGRPEEQLKDHTSRKDSNRWRDVPPAVSQRWRAIAKTLDHDKWNYGNVHEHPEYDPDWPYALTGHPMDSDWAGDWDSDDMRKSNEKRVKEESAQKAATKAGRGTLKERE